MKKIVCFIMVAFISLHAQTLNVVENEFIKIVTGPEGIDYPRFSIETTGGDPSRDQDDNLPLIYGRPKPWTSFTSIAIDNTVYGFGNPTKKRSGKTAKYGKVIASSITKEKTVVIATLGGIKATQTLSLFRNPLTNVKDSVLIEYRLINETNSTKNIGLRIMMDTMLGKNDAAPFRIGNDSVISETVYTGSKIMDYWQSFDSLVSPNIIAQGILRYTPASLTPPDQLILMNWGSLADNPYRVKVKKGRSFIREGEDEPDTALALFYEKKPLGPKKARTYRTVMGLGGVSLAPGDLALGLTFPSYIAITDPNIYTMIAYISNTGGFNATKATATIELPQGLVLKKGALTESLGNILPGGSRQLVYYIKMDPKNAREGVKNIKLTVKSSTLSDQTLTRKVKITGQPKLTAIGIGQPTIQRGFDQFVDVPVEIKNESDVAVSKVSLDLLAESPFSIPSFEVGKKEIVVLDPKSSRQISWKLKVDQWYKGNYQIPIRLNSIFTRPATINVPIEVTLGTPQGKLYYSEPQFKIGDYGYIWITLMDMPTFSGLDLRLTWNDERLKPIRVSPEPWLVESEPNIMQKFHVSGNNLLIKNLAAENPYWRTIIGKWHFKAIKNGEVTIKLWQGDEKLDEIKLNILKKEANRNDI